MMLARLVRCVGVPGEARLVQAMMPARLVRWVAYLVRLAVFKC